jgi:hypothetical protein
MLGAAPDRVEAQDRLRGRERSCVGPRRRDDVCQFVIEARIDSFICLQVSVDVISQHDAT